MKKKSAPPAEITNYSQWKLIRMRFLRHKLAVVSLVMLCLFYLVAIFADFIIPHPPNEHDRTAIFAPPTRIHFRDENGFSFRPFVHPVTHSRNPHTLAMEFEFDTSQRDYIQFFVRGHVYRLFGLFETDRHLFGTRDGTRIHLFGANGMGKDVFSATIYGSRISLTIGLVAIFISLTLGILIGSVAGYFGGLIDNLIQRFIEILRSIPSLPLWMVLSAAIPPNWSMVNRYLAITIILSFMGWTDMARVVRGKFLSLRDEDYITAARLSGVNEWGIITRHLVPSFSGYIITAATLSVPGMILSETALSFLGLGMQSPAVSWGVLLQDGQNVFALAHAPWLLIPGLFVIVTVLLFNFLGDGLRDAIDPYS